MRIASPVRYRASRPALALEVRYANPRRLTWLGRPSLRAPGPPA